MTYQNLIPNRLHSIGVPPLAVPAYPGRGSTPDPGKRPTLDREKCHRNCVSVALSHTFCGLEQSIVKGCPTASRSRRSTQAWNCCRLPLDYTLFLCRTNPQMLNARWHYIFPGCCIILSIFVDFILFLYHFVVI